jgi:hypothetical protein
LGSLEDKTVDKMAFFSTLLATCFYAWNRGGKPERVAALLFITAAVVSTMLASNDSVLFSNIEWGLFFVDILLAAFLIWLALSADRYWPMWLSALQIVSVLMHPAFGFSQNKMAMAYAIASIFWSYPMMLILILGTIRHSQRNQKVGAVC